MQLISTIMTTAQMEFTINVRSRNTNDPNRVAPDGDMITRYVSKIGNQSLIFAPSVAFIVKSRINPAISAFVPLSMFYRFTSTLSTVYQSLSTGKLYHTEGSTLFVDKNKANSCAKKVVLFRSTVTMIPDVYIDKGNTYTQGIAMLVDGNLLGIISHHDVMSLVEQLDHLDISTYSLMAGVIDEMEGMNNRLDAMNQMIQHLTELITSRNVPYPVITAEQYSTEPEFSWRGTGA